MTDPIDPDDELEAINDEHRQLRGSLSGLEQANDAAYALAVLRPLTPLLSSHFAREETAGGLHEIIRARSPRSVHTLESLNQEHGELRKQAEDLVRVLDGGDWNAGQQGILELVRRLRQHESRENQLLSDSVLLDLGSGD